MYDKTAKRAGENIEEKGIQYPSGNPLLGLLGPWTARQAGRTKALHTTHPELGEAPYSIRHPYWATFFASLGGAIPAAAIAAWSDRDQGRYGGASRSRDPLFKGIVGGLGGAVLGGLIMHQRILHNVRKASRNAQEAVVNEAAAKKRLAKIAERFGPMIPTGSYERGEVQQLHNILTGEKLRGALSTSVASIDPLLPMYLPGGLVSMGTTGYMGAKAYEEAQPYRRNKKESV
jgi:hypothetical protein